jgi:hypothetical protein
MGRLYWGGDVDHQSRIICNLDQFITLNPDVAAVGVADVISGSASSVEPERQLVVALRRVMPFSIEQVNWLHDPYLDLLGPCGPISCLTAPLRAHVGRGRALFVDMPCSSAVAIDSPSSDDVPRSSDPASVVVVVPADSSSSPLHAKSDNAIKTATPAATGPRADVRRMVPYLPLSRRLRWDTTTDALPFDPMTSGKKSSRVGRRCLTIGMGLRAARE